MFFVVQDSKLPEGGASNEDEEADSKNLLPRKRQQEKIIVLGLEKNTGKRVWKVADL